VACVPGRCLQKTAGKSTCKLRRCEDLQTERVLLGSPKPLIVPSKTARDNNGSTRYRCSSTVQPAILKILGKSTGGIYAVLPHVSVPGGSPTQLLHINEVGTFERLVTIRMAREDQKLSVSASPLTRCVRRVRKITINCNLNGSGGGGALTFQRRLLTFLTSHCRMLTPRKRGASLICGI
jgi:hypothetical protein